MLKKFEVKNFKNFKENIIIDFGNIGGYQFSTDCITDNLITKMLIYGRNATGKTNLGEAIMDIGSNLSNPRLGRLNENFFINADSNDNYSEFKYTFKFDDKEVIYKYSKFSNVELRDEELLIDERKIFYCNFSENKYNFDNLSYISAESVVLDRYLDSIKENDTSEDIIERALPFMRWLISNSALTTNSVLLKLDDYVRRMSMLTVGSMVMYRPKRMYDNFFEVLNDDSNQLKEFEEFLNIMGVECHLVLKKLPDGQNELYFKHKKLIPFYESASSGTLALLNLYRRFFIGKTVSSMMYLDEFDAFYHFEMAENLLKYFKMKFPNCQIILTSHNTNLMSNRLLRPDCLFILSRTGELTSLSNATQRELREGHNLEKMYISGEFEKYE
jgi:AAA15 family ATPase/GTPase